METNVIDNLADELIAQAQAAAAERRAENERLQAAMEAAERARMAERHRAELTTAARNSLNMEIAPDSPMLDLDAGRLVIGPMRFRAAGYRYSSHKGVVLWLQQTCPECGAETGDEEWAVDNLADLGDALAQMEAHRHECNACYLKQGGWTEGEEDAV